MTAVPGGARGYQERPPAKCRLHDGARDADPARITSLVRWWFHRWRPRVGGHGSYKLSSTEAGPQEAP